MKNSYLFFFSHTDEKEKWREGIEIDRGGRGEGER
jgi:hypothetical protein